MHRNASSAVAPASSLIVLMAWLGCSSSESSAPTPSPAPFESAPGSMGGEANAGEAIADDGSPPVAGAPSAGGTSDGPPAVASEGLMPMDVAAPGVIQEAAPAVPAQLCATKAIVQAPLIADFEGYDGTVEAAQFTFRFGSETPNSGALAGLFAYDDMTGTNARFGILAGRSGRWAASHQIVQASAWGGGMGLYFDCVDASAFSGISFWVRGVTGAGTFSFSMATLQTTAPDAADPRGGGTCTGGAELCRNPAFDAIPLALDWTLIEIPWASFTPGLANGAPLVPNGDELRGITFGLPIAWGPDPSFVDNPNDTTDLPTFLPLPSDIIFQVDDIAFMRP